MNCESCDPTLQRDQVSIVFRWGRKIGGRAGSVFPNSFSIWRGAVSPDGKLLAIIIELLDPNTQATQSKLALLRLDSDVLAPACLLELDQQTTGSVRFTPDGKAVAYPIEEKGVDNFLDPAARWVTSTPDHKLHLRTNRRLPFHKQMYVEQTMSEG